MTETRFRAALGRYPAEVLAAWIADHLGLLGVVGQELALAGLEETRAALGRERSLTLADRLAGELERRRARGGAVARLERGLDLLPEHPADPRAEPGYPGRRPPV